MDEWLMERMAQGDKEALRLLIDRHQSYVWKIAYRFLGTYEDAEDAAQEVFLKLFLKCKKYQQQGKFLAFLSRITANECLNRLRYMKKKSTVALYDEPPIKDKYCPLQLCESKELGEKLQQALASLPERQRLAFLMKIYGNLSYNEIGQAMGCSRVAIEGLIFRARKTLQQKYLRQEMEHSHVL